MADLATSAATLRRWWPARSLLAVLLVAMAAGQLSDVAGFARILATYRVLPGDVTTLAAWIVIATEALAGVALLRGAGHGATLATAVAVTWTLLGAQAFVRGLPIDNCGCFGVHLGQPLRWWVLLEDAEFIALAAWVRRAAQRGPRSSDQTALEPDRSSPLAAAGRRGRTR
jgi:hypothetical protein